MFVDQNKNLHLDIDDSLLDRTTELEVQTDKLMSCLNDHCAVLIMDEHGHAYHMLSNYMHGIDSADFRILQPNSRMNAPKVRLLFIGSNQSSFEISLNWEYVNCVEFATPLDDEDAGFLAVAKDWDTGDNEDLEQKFSFYSNGKWSSS